MESGEKSDTDTDKIYTSVVAVRLRDKMEEKYLLLNQTGNDLNGG